MKYVKMAGQIKLVVGMRLLCLVVLIGSYSVLDKFPLLHNFTETVDFSFFVLFIILQCRHCQLIMCPLKSVTEISLLCSHDLTTS